MGSWMSLFGFAVIVGCESGSDDTSDPSADTIVGDEEALAGMDFLLESSKGFDPVEGIDIHLDFMQRNTGVEFSLYGGCNSIIGEFSIDDGAMVISTLSMTEMGCGTPLMEQDQWLVDFMIAGPLLELEGNNLTLTGSKATLFFVDSEIADPDRSLTSNLWTIDSFIDGESISTANIEGLPTLWLENGNVEIYTACNAGVGTYTSDADQIEFSEFSLDSAECPDAMADEAESHVLSVLTGAVSYSIDASRITIENGDVGISGTTK